MQREKYQVGLISARHLMVRNGERSVDKTDIETELLWGISKETGLTFYRQIMSKRTATLVCTFFRNISDLESDKKVVFARIPNFAFS